MVVEVTSLLNNLEVPGHSTVIKVHDTANFHESLGPFIARVAKLKNTSLFGGVHGAMVMDVKNKRYRTKTLKSCSVRD